MNTTTNPRPPQGPLRWVAVCIAVGGLTGCVATSTPFPTFASTKFTLQNTDRFVPLDKGVQRAVTCTGLAENWLADGRMEVVANLKNRDDHPLEVQINCVFRDEHGFVTGDESAFQTVVLTQNATEAVRFTALNAAAKKYTIRVRQAR